MIELDKDVPRRRAIEAWVRYDAHKRAKPVPDLEMWPWEHADGLDELLKSLHFKYGIIAGYQNWTFCPVTLGELRQCAVVSGAVPGSVRSLGQLEGSAILRSWQPDRETSWYERLSAGAVLTSEEPLLIRRAVLSEAPSRWYLEDGSGRGLAIIKASCHESAAVVAYACVGKLPDHESLFMQQNFPGLLR